MQRHLVRRLLLLTLVVAVFGAIGSTAQAATSDLVAGKLWWSFDRGGLNESIGQSLAAGGAPVDWGTISVAGQASEGAVIDLLLGKVFWIENPGPETDVIIRGANLDGTDAKTLATITGGGSLKRGLTYDPTTRTLYWISEVSGAYGVWKSTVSADGTTADVATSPWYDLSSIGIGYNYLQAPVVDLASGRIYWLADYPPGVPGTDAALVKTVFYAKLDGTSTTFESLNPHGGTCATDPVNGAVFDYAAQSLVIDHAGGKLYIGGSSTVGRNSLVVRTDLDGGNCEMILDVASSEMYGLTVDPVAKRLYVGSRNRDEIYYVDLTTTSKNGVVTAITSHSCVVAVAACNKPVSLVLGLAPSGTAAVAPTTGKVGEKLTCTPTWNANDPALFMARAAKTTTYAWALDGTALTDTTAEITAAKAGTYTCTATGTNAIGSGTATATAKITAKAKKKAAKPRLTIISGNVRGGATLVVRVRASMAGTVRLTAKLDGAKACTASKKVAKGVATLLCPLSADAQATVATNATLFRLTGRLTTSKRQTANATGVVRAQPYAAQGVTG